MEFLTVMTAQTNLDVLQWNQINAIKKNISVARLLEFAFQLHGIVMVQMTATIIQMNRNVEQLHAQITSLSVKMVNVYLRHMFAMEQMIVVIIQMNRMNMHVFHHHLDAQSDNGHVLEFMSDVLISHQYVIKNQTVQMDLMKEKDVI